MKYDIIAIGGSTEDIMFYTKEAVLIKNRKDLLRQQLLGFEFGAKIVGERVFFTYGGGGANTAVNFAKLGLKTGVITAVGKDDTGRRVIKNLRDNRVATGDIQIYKSVPSGLSFIVNFLSTDEHVIFTYRSANDHLFISANDLNKIRTAWLYLTSISGANTLQNLKNIFNYAKNNNVKVAWNPGGNQLVKGVNYLKPFLKQSEVLIVNKDEAIELAGKKTQNIGQLLLIIKTLGPKIVAITEGKNGATACSDSQICFEKAYPVKAQNSTGAGDAFGAAFVGSFILDNDLNRAVRIGLIQSGHVVGQIGAQKGLLNFKQIGRLL